MTTDEDQELTRSLKLTELIYNAQQILKDYGDLDVRYFYFDNGTEFHAPVLTTGLHTFSDGMYFAIYQHNGNGNTYLRVIK